MSAFALLLQAAGDVPAGDAWLAPDERAELEAPPSPKRRADRRLGRWTAKVAIAGYLGLRTDAACLAGIAVGRTAAGAPVAYVDGERAMLTMSLSHRAERAACLVGPVRARVGCDLERVEPRAGSFAATFFTDREARMVRALAANSADVATTLLWAVKEAALKALGTGLARDTRSVVVTRRPLWDGPADAATGRSRWRRITALDVLGGASFDGCWRLDGREVLVLLGEGDALVPGTWSMLRTTG